MLLFLSHQVSNENICLSLKYTLWPHISRVPSCKYTFTGVPGETYDRLELEVQVGPQAEEMLMKKIDLNDEEITEGKPVLVKLQRLLNTAVNRTSVKKGSKSNSNSRSSDLSNRSVRSIGSTSASNTTSRSSGQRTHVIKVGAWKMFHILFQSSCGNSQKCFFSTANCWNSEIQQEPQEAGRCDHFAIILWTSKISFDPKLTHLFLKE